MTDLPPVAIAPHPLLEAGLLAATFPTPLGELAAPPWLADLLRLEAETPFERSDAVKKAVRDLLRHGGYKPTGRGKPASEYLARAAGEGKLAPINPAVDAGNAVSLASGLPVSVVDLDRATPPFAIDLAPEGASYVFNPAGQEIRLGGLLGLADAEGPCANGVKDAQRTKTDAGTRRTLSVVWGTSALPGRTAAAVTWHRELLERLGADVSASEPRP